MKEANRTRPMTSPPGAASWDQLGVLLSVFSAAFHVGGPFSLRPITLEFYAKLS